MKNQYVGDVNDFFKYAVLRALLRCPAIHTYVSWMRTPDDARGDGRILGYLQRADHRAIDSELFEAMTRVVAGDRCVEAVERARILPFVRGFQLDLLEDSAAARNAYFDALWGAIGSARAVFFDPDNGFETASVPAGRRNSSRYLYWNEFERACASERSVIVYQHFPRRERSAFARDIVTRAAQVAPEHSVFAIYTSRVAFVVAAAAREADSLLDAARGLVRQRSEFLRMT